ncbi:MAG: peptidase T, partial [Firmicutes bacterium]|nr:peptidase T [Bacillota bacterium]
MNITERFMQYVQYNTQSGERSDTFPSTESQLAFGRVLADDLRAIGVQDVQQDAYGYVTGTIPATTEQTLPVVGFLAHMDTAPDFTADGVKPRLIEDYAGGDIVLNEEQQIITRVQDFPSLLNKVGKRLIVTDGTTLLGGDDKAGICIIFAMAEYLLAHPEIPHGKIRIAFTPDEEIGSGVDHFDVEAFGADYAYTIDGGGLGGIEYETFNAASAKVEVQGKSSHPGSGKGHMKHAAEIAMDFHHMLPAQEKAQYTEGYEGFIHLLYIGGSVEHTEMYYIIRDHDRTLFEQKKALMQKTAEYINEKYGAGTLALTVTDSYYNMREKIEQCKKIVD